MQTRARLILLGAALLAAPLVATATATPAAAAPPDQYGFAYLDDSTPVPNYVPDPTRQWNTTGALNTVSATAAVGAYQVTFPGLGVAGGIAHVTAVTRTGEWCQIEKYAFSGANELVDVRCFDRLGVAANSRFAVLFTDGSSVPPGGAAYAAVKVTAGGTVVTSLNSAGAVNTVGLQSPGVYTVTLPTVGAAAERTGGVQVTAANGTVAARCKVATWTTSAGGQQVEVHCVNSAGAPTNAGWTLSYQHKRSIVRGGAVPPTKFGYVHDNLGVPPPGTTYNSGGGAVNVTPGGIGLRTISFPLIGLQQDHMQVTAFGRGSQYCTLAQPWTVSANTVTMRYVVCYLTGGTLSTQQSLVTYTSRT